MRYVHLSGAGALSLVSQLVDLYAIVYAEPPYEEGPEQVARFAKAIPQDLDAEGCALTGAVIGDRLVGAAYGLTMAAGRWWSNTEDEPPPDLRDTPKFAVMEWMVHPAERGTGVGSRLMQMLLSQRPEPYAVLASDPRSVARTMYDRAGWRQVGQSRLTWGPVMDLLVLPLRHDVGES